MVHGSKSLLLLIPLKQRELRHPQEPIVILFKQTHLGCQLQAQRSKHCPDSFVLVCRKEEQIAVFSSHGADKHRHFFLCHELCKRRFPAAVLPDGNIGKPFCSVIFRKAYQLVNLLSWHAALSFGVDAPDSSPIFNRVFKYGKFTVLYRLRHIRKLHPETDVRLVRTIAVHRLLPCHPWYRQRHGHSQHFFKHFLKQPLVYINHVIHIHKGKLHIDLRKFRLAVCSQILVPETFRNLKIPVAPGAHQELLKKLRRLGKGIESSLVDTARHKVVPCTLRRAADKDRRLYLQKSFICKELPGQRGNFAPHHEVPLHVRPSQV